MSEITEFFVGIGLILLIIFGSIGYIGYLSNIHEEHMASLGYVEQQAIGSATTIWIKGDVCK